MKEWLRTWKLLREGEVEETIGEKLQTGELENNRTEQSSREDIPSLHLVKEKKGQVQIQVFFFSFFFGQLRILMF